MTLVSLLCSKEMNSEKNKLRFRRNATGSRRKQQAWSSSAVQCSAVHIGTLAHTNITTNIT